MTQAVSPYHIVAKTSKSRPVFRDIYVFHLQKIYENTSESTIMQNTIHTQNIFPILFTINSDIMMLFKPVSIKDYKNFH